MLATLIGHIVSVLKLEAETALAGTSRMGLSLHGTGNS